MIDARSDIYSLGRTLYELLTGSLPTAGTELPATIPPAFRRLLSVMLQPDPAARPSSIVDVQKQLCLIELQFPRKAGDNTATAAERSPLAIIRLSGRTAIAAIVVLVIMMLSAAAFNGSSPVSFPCFLVIISGNNIAIGNEDQTQNLTGSSTEKQPAAMPTPDRDSPVDAVSSEPEREPALLIQPKLDESVVISRTLPELRFVRLTLQPFQMGTGGGRSAESIVQSDVVGDYLIGQTEVTQSQWNRVLGTSPWQKYSEVPQQAQLPAVGMTFREAQDFVAELSRRDGQAYDLPSEPEWEFAASGGVHTGGDPGLSGSWTLENSGGRLQPVAQLPPNSVGLYDMTGNAAEWSRDWYVAARPINWSVPAPAVQTHRTVRGGSWADDVQDCQAWSRSNFSENEGSAVVGIRLILRRQISDSTAERGANP